MAGDVPSKENYPAIERMLANCAAWCAENPVEQLLAVSCEPGLDTSSATRPTSNEVVNVQVAA